jgi:hypothetical protein
VRFKKKKLVTAAEGALLKLLATKRMSDLVVDNANARRFSAIAE